MAMYSGDRDGTTPCGATVVCGDAGKDGDAPQDLQTKNERPRMVNAERAQQAIDSSRFENFMRKIYHKAVESQLATTRNIRSDHRLFETQQKPFHESEVKYSGF